jgi:hypothetical protein
MALDFLKVVVANLLHHLPHDHEGLQHQKVSNQGRADLQSVRVQILTNHTMKTITKVVNKKN